ncbi:MAG: FAD synthetase family protein [Lentisphaerota bacterium]
MKETIPLEVDKLSNLHDLGIGKVSAAIGVFDGIHLGHRAILSEIIKASEKNNSTPIVITFYPHPRQVLGIDENIKFLRSPQDKLAVLGSLGIKAVVTVNFTNEIANMKPEEFIDYLIGDSLSKLVAVCVGRRWRFGTGATGSVHVLKEIAQKKNFEVFPVNEIHLPCGRVSSSAIRKALSDGNLELAREMLVDKDYLPN